MITTYTVIAVAVFVSGTLMGSFFTVVISRLPRGESVVRPGSRCPHCHKPVIWYYNIPVIGYLLCRGRCAKCGKKISPHYLFIEAVGGVIALVLWTGYVSPRLPEVSILQWDAAVLGIRSITLWLCLPIAILDFRYRVIPDSFTITGLSAALVVSLLPGGITVLFLLIGGCVGGGTLYVIGYVTQRFVTKRPAIGGGDIKFMMWMGALWGWKYALMILFLGSLFGIIAGLGGTVAGRGSAIKKEIPFGPFLVAGVWLSAFFGDALFDMYFQLLGI